MSRIATVSVAATTIQTEEDALAAISEMGFFGLAMDVVGATEEFHWHDFDTIVYIMSGKVAAEYEDGNVLTAGPGHVAHLPVGIVHRDVPGVTFRGVFGFSVDPSSMANPVNKPLDQLPGAAE